MSDQVLAFTSKSGADAVAAAIVEAGGRAIAVQGDVAKAADAQSIIAAAISNYGRLDILVNNAGIYEMLPLEAITDEHFRRQFDINVLGLLFVSQAAVKHLGEGASIINIGSVVSRITPPNAAVYTATKGAVAAITGVLARELGPCEHPEPWPRRKARTAQGI
jgi:3-oxoacyl-[acyl-carrier protein] reductase